MAAVKPTEIAQILKKKNNFIIVGHARPDGDTVGSAAALAFTLRSFGKKAVCLCSDDIPERLKFISKEEFAFEPVPKTIKASHFVIVVDTAAPHLLGNLEGLLTNNVDLLIDHHPSSSIEAEYTYVDPTASACGELVYRIMLALSKETLPPDALTAVYAAISSDSGCFMYGNTTAKTHKIAADLVARGVDGADINDRLFRRKSLSEVRAAKLAYANINFYRGGKITLVNFTNYMKKEEMLEDEDLGSVVNIAKEIDGVELALFIKEIAGRDGEYKLSVRSDPNIDASAICKAFGGGGHHQAAGATFSAVSPESAQRLVLNAVYNYYELYC